MSKTKFLVGAVVTAAAVSALVFFVRVQAAKEAQQKAKAALKKEQELGHEIMRSCDEGFAQVLAARLDSAQGRAAQVSEMKKALYATSGCLRAALKKLGSVVNPAWQIAEGRTGAAVLQARLARVSSELDLLTELDPAQKNWVQGEKAISVRSEEVLKRYELRFSRYAEAHERLRDPDEKWHSELYWDVPPNEIAGSVLPPEPAAAPAP